MIQVRVEPASFQTDRDAIYAIRRIVFVVEQAVPENIEIDEYDALAHHVLAWSDGQAVGTGRFTTENGVGRIGRMAVLRDWRGRGVGRAILDALIALGSEMGMERLVLSAQCHAIPFYEKSGFVAEGSVYQDAGIDHRRMVWRGPA
jgi:predicted GNAT family N-acyltransferase